MTRSALGPCSRAKIRISHDNEDGKNAYSNVLRAFFPFTFSALILGQGGDRGNIKRNEIEKFNLFC